MRLKTSLLLQKFGTFFHHQSQTGKAVTKIYMYNTKDIIHKCTKVDIFVTASPDNYLIGRNM
jgi:hypothetical protein